jgi:hypothetical protein
MIINAYEFTVENNGEDVAVSLRLGAGGQLKLKKKWNESTTSTLFGAVDDIERMIDVLDNALKYKGNTNTVKSGEDLYELMVENDMLGMKAKQLLITSIGRASGLFSEEEKDVIDKRSEHLLDDAFGDEDAGKNVK